MKKLIYLFAAFLLVTLTNCEKKEQVPESFIVKTTPDTKLYIEGQFRKEIVVSDETGKNKAFFAIYSDDENLLNDYLTDNELTLRINLFDIDSLKTNNNSNPKQTKTKNGNFDLNQKPRVTVELLKTNMQNQVQSYSLNVKSVRLKSTEFVLGYPVAYTTHDDFIAVVHQLNGSEFLLKIEYKLYWYTLNWTYLEVGGVNSWFIYQTGPYYSYFNEDVHERGMVIYPDYYQQTLNYDIIYTPNNLRSHVCQIGTHDPNNYGECYVGTAPTGTAAFYIYPYFYYTPLSGNSCPIGLGFDGANCVYCEIPAGCEAYLWQNNWLIKSDLIPVN